MAHTGRASSRPAVSAAARMLLAAALFCAAFGQGAAEAQQQPKPGSMSGSVFERENSSNVAGATIRITHGGSGTVQSTLTDRAGNFRFPQLAPGLYSLEFTARGFRTLRRDGIVVEPGHSVAVPLVVNEVYYTIAPGMQNATPSYIGAKACGSCHAAQFAQQSASEHAQALYRAAEHPLAKAFTTDRELERAGRFHFQYLIRDKELRVKASDETDTMDVPVQWAFGAGEGAVTFVTQVNGDVALEHSYSYYPAIKALAISPGHEAVPQVGLTDAMGILRQNFDPQSMLACLQCHSTGPVSVTIAKEFRPSELGVRCEICHGPGSLHRDAAAKGDARQARGLIQNPNRMSALEINSFCGACHRPPVGPGADNMDWTIPWNVRHHPLHLAQSACFRKSNGGVSCLTCHDPHAKLQTDLTRYSEKCAACHNAKTNPPKPVCLQDASVACASCHMPGVSPQPYLKFTNHWIGVYAEGSKLRPAR